MSDWKHPNKAKWHNVPMAVLRPQYNPVTPQQKRARALGQYENHNPAKITLPQPPWVDSEESYP